MPFRHFPGDKYRKQPFAATSSASIAPSRNIGSSPSAGITTSYNSQAHTHSQAKTHANADANPNSDMYIILRLRVTRGQEITSCSAYVCEW